MKNKVIIFLIYFLFNCNLSHADQYEFYATDLNASYSNNTIKVNKGTAISKNKNLKIKGNFFEYNKNSELLKVTKGKVFEQINNLEISFDNLEIDGKKLFLIAYGNVEILDKENKLIFETSNIEMDRLNNILRSSTKTFIKDNNDNLFQVDEFVYNIKKNILKIKNISFKDVNDNKLFIDSAFINTKSKKLIGKDAKINLNNVSFNDKNEPRIKGVRIKHDEENTEVSKGVFTACKKTDKCPPWQLTAEKITHNKNKKNIDYKNVWLKIYDVPVVYFPKFFHPDPTVKRQTGFLMPSFKSSPNKNTFFSIPYFKVLGENKDLTLTPRLYSEKKIMVQTEFREVTKNGNYINDFSLFKNKNNLDGHFFHKLNKNLDTKKFDTSSIEIKIQQTSNDTYLKANKLVSPTINNYDLLENSINLILSNEQSLIETDFIVFENLNKSNNDKYEYVYPKFNFERKLNNNTKLKGDFIFQSNNYVHKFDTNVSEKINTNDLIFKSDYKVTKSGFYNNFEFKVKNSNTSRENSKDLKNGENIYYSGIYQLNTSLPLVKLGSNFQRLINPKLSLKFSPGYTKNISKNYNRLDINNIFDLNRISSSETLEGGLSLTYGSDYILSNSKSDREILSFKFANNLRLKENKNLEKNNQLGAKTSNLFSEISFSPNKYFKTKYNVSLKNNFVNKSYENFVTEFSINNFVTKFDYLNENNASQNSYILNETSYNFNEANKLSFSTRQNKKTDLVEYYNLIYQYENDCLAASIEYNKEYYNDRDIKPDESIFFKLTIVPFGKTSTPNLIN
tara:strand:+ start:3986 stop:6361 length:2376 start_codon:yes stop_codon:yes gene_type:complete